MKKFFALALAAAMVMSLASAAFAADILDDAAFDKPLDYSGDADNLKYNKTYDPDWSSTTNNSIKLGNMIEYGDTAYYPLVEVSGPNAGPMTNYKQVEKLKIKAEFEMGEGLVESISIVKKPIAAVDGQDSTFALDLSEAVNIEDFIVVNEGAPVINAVWTGGPNINDINVSVIPYSFVNIASSDVIIAAAKEIINNAVVDYYGTEIPSGIIDATAGALAGQIGSGTGSVLGNISSSIGSINANNFTYLTVKSADGRILEDKDDVLDLLPTGANAPNIGDPIDSSVCTFELNIDKLLEDFAIFNADTAANIVAGAMNALTNPPSAVGSEIIWGDINVDYYYFVAVKTKKVETTADADIIGTFEFKRKAVKENGVEIYPEIKDEEHDFAINLWYDGNYSNTDALGETYYTVDDEATLKWDDMYILKFDSDDEVTLNFGYENEGEFTFDASGQGKMLINFNTNANEAICDANPGVEMFFVNFNGAKFNRTGTFEYEMENMAAAYEVVDGKLVEIKGLELDGDTATFATRTLGNYVFAAAELVDPVA